MNVVEVVQKSRMSPWQYVVVGLCMIGNLTDGFEIAVMGFALPLLPETFATTAEKGWLASAALIGMGLGALFLAPLGDRYGRRTLLISASALSSVGLAVTALAPNFQIMFALRIVTGLGVGVVGALTVVLVQEYSPPNRRNLNTSLSTAGFAIGGFLAGAVSLVSLALFNGAWQGLFVSGSMISLVGTVAMLFLLPESLHYLASQKTERSRQRIMRIADQMKLKNVDPYAEVDNQVETTNSRSDNEKDSVTPFHRRYFVNTILLTVGYTLVIAAYYFVTNWTPQLVTEATGDTETGAFVGTVVTVGAVSGALIFGVLGARILATKLGVVLVVIGMVAQIVFALTVEGNLALIAAALMGMGAFSGMAAYLAAAPPLYPSRIRGAALGFIVGVSRAGSIGTPVAAGYLLAIMAGVSLYIGSSSLLGLSAVLLIVLWRRNERQSKAGMKIDTAPTAKSTPDKVGAQAE